MPISKLWALALWLLAASVCSAAAQEVDKGRKEYLRSCAECHGEDGSGRGAASQFKMKPGDLRTLARKNRAVYSPEAVYQMIDGRNPSSRHARSEMPVWGCRRDAASGTADAATKKKGRLREIWRAMKEDRQIKKSKKKRKNKTSRVKGERPDAFLDLPCDSEAAIKDRIQSVVDYLRTIQVK